MSRDSLTWQRLGGTVDGRDRISLSTKTPGRHALFADHGGPPGSDALVSLSFTPRVFSPTGGFGNREVGIGFTLGRSGAVTVRVYNPTGRLMRELLSSQVLPAGANLAR